MTEKEEEDNQQLEDDGVEYVLKQHWRRYLNVLRIFWFKFQDHWFKPDVEGCTQGVFVYGNFCVEEWLRYSIFTA